MMGYISVSDLFTGICDAIRAKDGTTEPINHVDIPDRIYAINKISVIGSNIVCPVVSVVVSSPTVTVSEAQVTSE